MTEQTEAKILVPTKPFVSAEDAAAKIEELFALAPCRASRSWLWLSYLQTSTSNTATVSHDGRVAWSIAVTIMVPAELTLLTTLLARWGIESARKKIEFLITGEAGNTEEELAAGINTAPNKYAFFNGGFVHDFFTVKPANPRPFADPRFRTLWNSEYHDPDFDRMIDVSRSEISGEPVAMPPLEA